MAPTKWDPASTDGENVTFSATLFDSTLSHYVGYFPISILNATLLANARTDYQDIRIYSSTGTEYDRIITPGGSCFVRIPSASSSVSTVLDINAGSGVSKGNDTTALTTAGSYNWLNCDESSGNLIDSTGNYDGTASGLTYSQTGVIEDAVYSNEGSNANVNIGSSVSEIRNASNSLTITAWVNFDDMSADNEFVFDTNASANERIIIGKSSGGNFLTQIGDGTNVRQQNYNFSDLTAGVFQRYDYVYSIGSSVTLYLNGAALTPVSSSGTVPTTLGSYTGINSYWCGRGGSSLSVGGDFDLMRLNSNALSADYVKAQYNNEDDYATYVTASNYTEFGVSGVVPILLMNSLKGCI